MAALPGGCGAVSIDDNTHLLASSVGGSVRGEFASLLAQTDCCGVKSCLSYSRLDDFDSHPFHSNSHSAARLQASAARAPTRLPLCKKVEACFTEDYFIHKDISRGCLSDLNQLGMLPIGNAWSLSRHSTAAAGSSGRSSAHRLHRHSHRNASHTQHTLPRSYQHQCSREDKKASQPIAPHPPEL